MKDSLFRDWDNRNKYVKAPYQDAIVKVGHIEYLYDYLKENSLSDWTSQGEGYSIGEVVFDGDGLYRNTLENNISKPSVNSPTNGWKALFTNSGGGSTLPYKVYTATVIQLGNTDDPQVFIHDNNTGGTIDWIRLAVGGYKGELIGITTVEEKIWYSPTPVIPFFIGAEFVGGLRTLNSSNLGLGVYDVTGDPIDGFFANIEIRFYE